MNPESVKGLDSADPGPSKRAPGHDPTLSAPGSAGDKTENPPVVLSPEEQMALDEKELKENDWGHQPC